MSLFIEWKNDPMCALSVISRGRFMPWTKPSAATRSHHLVACDLLGSDSDVCFALESKRAVPLFISYPSKERRPKRLSLGRLQGT